MLMVGYDRKVKHLGTRDAPLHEIGVSMANSFVHRRATILLVLEFAKRSSCALRMSKAETKPLLGVEEAAAYDPHVGATRANNYQSAANIVKSFVGVGILGLPYALRQGGLWV